MEVNKGVDGLGATTKEQAGRRVNHVAEEPCRTKGQSSVYPTSTEPVPRPYPTADIVLPTGIGRDTSPLGDGVDQRVVIHRRPRNRPMRLEPCFLEVCCPLLHHNARLHVRVRELLGLFSDALLS